MKIYSNKNKPYTYLGQCDRLRFSKENEIKWQNMIKNHIKIDINQFKKIANYEVILDGDETLEDYVSDDSSSYFAISKWGDKDCCYIMTKGFEFIFTV